MYDEDRSQHMNTPERNSPSPYSDPRLSLGTLMSNSRNSVTIPYQHTTQKAQTLPDLDYSRNNDYALIALDDPSMRSYSSINGIYMPKKNLCTRSKSATTCGNSERQRTLSRQCCDVLGPKVCRECALLKRRIYDSYKQERPLSRMEISERNLADSITLSKALPDMSIGEIEDKVISGDILRVPLRERLLLKRQRTNLEAKQRAKTAPSSTGSNRSVNQIGMNWNRVTSTYFMSLRDLNNKILIGKLTNKLGNLSNPKDNYWVGDNDTNNNIKPESGELVLVDKKPEEETKAVKPRQILFYEPPLVPRVCQSVEPAFFAGSDAGYKLPDRLPDQVVEGQIDDFSAFKPALSRASSSTSQSQSESQVETS